MLHPLKSMGALPLTLKNEGQGVRLALFVAVMYLETGFLLQSFSFD